MVKYDSSLIYQFAASLYKQVGVVIGLVGGYLVTDGRGGTVTVVGGLLLGAIGWWIGTQKAFALKLQAQIALCQVQIEENTRGRGVSGGSLPQSSGARTAV
jgi:hypothetical protein